MSYTIGKLAQLTGFSTNLIRVWERRHAFLRPERRDNGFRRYTREDLAVLQGIRSLLERGDRIGDIARISRLELAQVGASEAARDTQVRSPSDEDYLDGRHPDIAWSILDGLPCAVIVTDVRGLVRWVNRGVVLLCGYDLAELHGRRPGSVLQGPKTDRETVEQMRAAVANLRPCSVTVVNYHKSGEPYHALVDVTPLRIGVQHVGFVGIARKLVSESLAAE